MDHLWDRIFAMVEDESAEVRGTVLHVICDGSPSHLESRVHDALVTLSRDADRHVRRTANRVLASYERTGKWNVL